MADVNYDNIPSIIGIYEGTVASFEEIMNGTDTAKKQTFYGRLILITGDQTATDENAADRKQALWTSEDDGTNAHYLNMSDVATLKAQLAHVDALAFPNKENPSIYDKYDLTGGKGFVFKGSNGITVTLNPKTSQTIDGKPYWFIEVNGETLKADLIGTSNNSSNTPNTITGAKAYTDKVAGDLKGTKADGDDTAETIRGAKDYADAKISDAKTELKGTKADGDNTAETIRGAKDYADKVAASKASAAKDEAIQESQEYVDPLLANKADLDNGKIPAGQLPDYILGQMLFGGTIDGGTQTEMIVDPTTNLMNKLGKTDADLNADDKLVISHQSSQVYEGVYFISSINFGNTNVVNIPDVRIGDWIISTGTSWRKVDNTDAIVKVAGVTPVNGDIKASDLAQKLAETGDANELALKSELTWDNVKPSDGIVEDDLAGSVVQKLNKGYSSVQSVSEGDFISITDTSATTGNKSYKVSAKTKTMEAAKEDILLNGEDALATAHDVYNFIKARLSVKVVS